MEDIDFRMDIVAENSKKLQKISLKGKISWTLDVFTLPNLESLNSTNVKNKKMCSQLGQWHKIFSV